MNVTRILDCKRRRNKNGNQEYLKHFNRAVRKTRPFSSQCGSSLRAFLQCRSLRHRRCENSLWKKADSSSCPGRTSRWASGSVHPVVAITYKQSNGTFQSCVSSAYQDVGLDGIPADSGRAAAAVFGARPLVFRADAALASARPAGTMAATHSLRSAHLFTGIGTVQVGHLGRGGVLLFELFEALAHGRIAPFGVLIRVVLQVVVFVWRKVGHYCRRRPGRLRLGRRLLRFGQRWNGRCSSGNKIQWNESNKRSTYRNGKRFVLHFRGHGRLRSFLQLLDLIQGGVELLLERTAAFQLLLLDAQSLEELLSAHFVLRRVSYSAWRKLPHQRQHSFVVFAAQLALLWSVFLF